MNDYLETKELYHHGIKGQKWGIRRYQNDDGTLTEAGKERYSADSVDSMGKEYKKLYNADRKQALRDAKEDRKQLYKIYDKDTSNKKIKEKFGDITAKDLMSSDRNSKLGKKIAIGSAVVAAASALTYEAVTYLTEYILLGALGFAIADGLNPNGITLGL